MSRQIQAVAFDVGNVLIDWDPGALPGLLAEATGLEGERAVAAARALFDRSKRRLDLGSIGPRDFHADLAAILRAEGGRAIPFAEMCRIWCATVRPRPGATALVRRLRRGIPYAIWSDTDPVHFGHWSRWLPFLAQARSLWLSFLAGVGKPDPAFFDGAVAALGAPAGATLFVDDTERNVEGARARGIVAEQVRSLAELEAALARHDLLEG